MNDERPDMTADVREAWLSSSADAKSATVPAKRSRGRPPAPFKLNTPLEELARPHVSSRRELVGEREALGDVAPKPRTFVTPNAIGVSAPPPRYIESLPEPNAISSAPSEPQEVSVTEPKKPEPRLVRPAVIPCCTMTGCMLAGELLQCADGHVRCIAHAAALMLEDAPGGPKEADRELVQRWLDDGGMPGELPERPSFTVSVSLNPQQEALLDNLVSVGLYGSTAEAACHFLIAEGLARHFPRAFASLGFKP